MIDQLNDKHILVADDEVHLRDLLKTVLSQHGARVTVAADGAAAFRAASMDQPDLVLMDLNMPGVNGLEAIRSLRVTLPGTPILVLTGYSTDSNLDAARDAGATLCLSKPQNLADLVKHIVELVTADTADGSGGDGSGKE